MKFLRLAPALLTAACAAASAPPSVPIPPEEASFSLRQGANVLASELFRRTDRLLEVDLTVLNAGRVSYTAELRPDASIARIDVRQYAPGAAPDAAPAQRSSGVFQGDTVALTQGEGAAMQTARRATAPGVIPYINPSPSLMEQIVRRAKAIGGDRVDVPIWVPGGGGQNATATVQTTAPDSVRLTVGTTEVLLQIDPRGRVLGGSVPAQGLTLERTAPVPR